MRSHPPLHPSLRSLEKLSSALGSKMKWKIVPNYFRELPNPAGPVAALQKRYPGRVVPFSIPYDEGFSSCLISGETPFFSRVKHETATQCCRLVAELFPVDLKKMETAVDAECRSQRPAAREMLLIQDKESRVSLSRRVGCRILRRKCIRFPQV